MYVNVSLCVIRTVVPVRLIGTRLRHSMDGWVVVCFRGPQRHRLGSVPGGVYDLSGLLV